MADNAPQRGNGVPQISESTLRELLAVQQQELSIRFKEIERDNAEISLNTSVAQLSIEAQERDAKHDREEQTKRQKTRQNFVLAATVVVLFFCGYCLHAGQSALLVDLIKVVLGFVGGIGYATARNKRKAPSE